MPATIDQGDVSQFAFVPAGRWQPDIPPPSNDGLISGLNLVPKSNGFYGPERGPRIPTSQTTTVFGSATKAHGDFHSVPPVPGGSARFYVGTFASAANASKILSQEENGAWSDLTRTSSGYTITIGEPWRFANFGQKVFAASRAEPLQVSDGGAAVFDDVTDAPNFYWIAEVNGFIAGVRLNDNNHGEGVQNFRVWWSSIGDGESWPDPTTDAAINTLSGFQDLFGGGILQAIIPGIGGADAIVVAERKMWRMNFVGPPAVFQFDEIESDQGTPVPSSIAVYNDTFFFFGQNGFYWFDGQNAHPIGQGQMDEFFDGDVDISTTFFTDSWAAATDRINKNYVLAYRNGDATGANNNRILRFNWLTQMWSNSEQAIDVMGSLDNEDSNTDSVRLHVMGSDFQTALLDGTTLAATIVTSEHFSQQGYRLRIKSVLPLLDASTVNTVIQTRDRLDQTPTDSASRSWSNHGTMRYDDVKVTGRFYRCQITVPAAQSWTAFQGVQYEATPWSHGPRTASA